MSLADVVHVSADTDRNIKISFRTKRDRTAVVVEVRFIHLEKNSFALEVGLVFGCCFHLEFGKPAGAVPILRCARTMRSTIKNIKLAVLLKLGVERESE